MKKLKKEALVKPNGRKVVIMEEDIKKYCDGTHKLPEHMMNTPVVILKKEDFEKIVSGFRDGSRKRKAEKLKGTANVPNTKFLKKSYDL